MITTTVCVSDGVSDCSLKYGGGESGAGGVSGGGCSCG